MRARLPKFLSIFTLIFDSHVLNEMENFLLAYSVIIPYCR